MERSLGAGCIGFPERRARADAGGSCLARLRAPSLAWLPPASRGPRAKEAARLGLERPLTANRSGRACPWESPTEQAASAGQARRDAPGSARRRTASRRWRGATVHDGGQGPDAKGGGSADQRSLWQLRARQRPATGNEQGEESQRYLHMALYRLPTDFVFIFHRLMFNFAC